MTKEEEWKMAKWLWHHGKTYRKDLPTWMPSNLTGKFEFFCACSSETNENGYPLIGENDLFLMDDDNVDAYLSERRRRIHRFRDWIVPSTSIAAIIISIAALALSIISLVLQI